MQDSNLIGGLSVHRLKRLSDSMRQAVENKRLSGVVTLLYRKGEIAHFEAHGMADIESNIPMRTDTLFRLFSMTKPVTSVALLMLLEAGKLRLNDPVAKYIPAFSKMKVIDSDTGDTTTTVDAVRPITLYHLLTHMSGLSYGFGDSSIDQLYRDTFWHLGQGSKPDSDEMLKEIARLSVAYGESLEAVVDQITALPLAFQPGTTFKYSVATDILGRVVEIVSGMCLPDFVRQNIFETLGMVDTDFHVPADKVERFTSVYGRRTESEFECQDPRTTSLFLQPPAAALGGSGLVGTAEDFLQFAKLTLNKGLIGGERLLSRTTVDLMTRDHLPVSVSNDLSFGFGLGVSVQRPNSGSHRQSYPGTYGWAGAAGTDYWVDPAEQMIGVIMIQALPNHDNPIVEDFRNLAYQAIAD